VHLEVLAEGEVVFVLEVQALRIDSVLDLFVETLGLADGQIVLVELDRVLVHGRLVVVLLGQVARDSVVALLQARVELGVAARSDKHARVQDKREGAPYAPQGILDLPPHYGDVDLC